MTKYRDLYENQNIARMLYESAGRGFDSLRARHFKRLIIRVSKEVCESFTSLFFYCLQSMEDSIAPGICVYEEQDEKSLALLYLQLN